MPRPRKNTSVTSDQISPAAPSIPATNAATPEKRKRGRPRKQPPTVATAEQKAPEDTGASDLPHAKAEARTRAKKPKAQVPRGRKPKQNDADPVADHDDTARAAVEESDNRTRTRIREDLDTNLLVEAVPGSGKTYNLIQRLVSLVKRGIPISEVVAITFTRKAAEELKLKFRAALEKEQRENPAQIPQHALEQIEDGYMGTIHGFCARLIREFPIEAGFDPTFEEIEEEEDTLLLQEQWSDYLTRNPDLVRRFTSLNHSLSHPDILRCVRSVADYIVDTEFPSTVVAEPEVSSIAAKLAEMFRDIDGLDKELAKLGDKAQEKAKHELALWDSIRDIQSRVARLPRPLSAADFLRVTTYWPGSTKLSLVEDTPFAGTAEAAKRIDEFAKELKEFRKQYAVYQYPFLLDHVKRFVFEAGNDRRRRGLATFADLLSGAVELLKNHPAIRALCAKRYQRLLIDEFQDTDPQQAELAFLLTANEQTRHETDWRLCVPKPGSLFLVGDPKQAIYRFRRADIRMYELVRRRLLETGGQVLPLQTTWRSQPDLCAFVNRAFGAPFKKQAKQGQIDFASIVPNPETGRQAGPAVVPLHVPVSKDCDDVTKVMHENEVDAVVHAVTQLVRTGHPTVLDGKPVAPEKIMILAQANNSLTPVAKALENAGIPVSLSGGGSELGNTARQPFEWLYWLLRAVSDASEPGVLYSVLCGPFFGVNDSQVFEYLAPYDEQSPRRKLNHPVPDEKKETEVGKALRTISRFRRWVKTLAPGAAFRKICRHIGFDTFLLCREDGFLQMRFLRDFERLFDGQLFRQALDNMMTWLSAWPNTSRPIEPGHVQMMSIHKAKGLEAEIVFLVGLRTSNRQPPEHLCLDYSADGKPTGHLWFSYKPKPESYVQTTIACSPEFERLKVHANNASHTEELRKQYVAATRAKNLLVISRLEFLTPAKPNAKEQDLRHKTYSSLRTELAAEVSGLAPAEFGPAHCEPPVIVPPDVVEEGDDESSEIDIPEFDFDSSLFLDGRAPLVPPRDKKISDAWSTFQQTQKQLHEQQAIARVQIKRATAVTTDAALARQVFRRNPAGGGMRYGSALHRVLELAMRERVVWPAGRSIFEMLVKQAIEENPEIAKHEAMLSEEAARVVQSSMWQEALASSACYPEVPLLSPVHDRRSLPPTAQEGESLMIEGVIDLIYRVDSGWKLIDYKTDYAENDEHLKQLADFHAPQLRLYEQLWHRQTGEPVVQVALYFVRLGRLVNVATPSLNPCNAEAGPRQKQT